MSLGKKVAVIVFVLIMANAILYWATPLTCNTCGSKITSSTAYNYRGALIDVDDWTGGRDELYHGTCWKADKLFK